jgi:hypothetical protein
MLTLSVGKKEERERERERGQEKDDGLYGKLGKRCGK